MNRRDLTFMAVGLLAALAIATVVSPFASTSPDGLEKVAEEKGFRDKGEGDPAWKSAPAPDYAIPGIHHERYSTGVAGLAGTLLVFGAAFGLGKWLQSRRKHAAPSAGEVS